MKIAATVWVAFWFPIYFDYYGFANFLHLSDIAIALTVIGLWTSSSLLISSQAVSVLIGDTATFKVYSVSAETGQATLRYKKSFPRRVLN